MTENRRIPRLSGAPSWMMLAIVVGSGCAGMSRSLIAPEVELVSLSVLGATIDKQRFALTLLISNPNTDPVAAQDLRYSVRVAGEGYLNGNSGAPIVLNGSERQTLRVEIETDTVSSVSRLLAVAQGPDNSLTYELTGDLILGGRPPRLLSFAYRGDVSLTIPDAN